MRRIGTIMLTLTVVLVGLSARILLVQSASMYANPAFEQQWKTGEAITPNLWGPLANATGGMPEAYKDAPNMQRIVQYFDKGRMEVGANNTVTNGLLATEITKGQIQTGDATFQNQPPPAIPIAGDADGVGPTYAGLAGKGATLFAATTKQPATGAIAKVAADGTISAGSPGADATALAAFDEITKHNIPQAFADYRTKVGISTIGLAISEPFLANVKVGGKQVDVMAQVFERRVLTYTASNPDAFKVEMGNIGQHYYKWRYSGGAAAPPVSGSSPPATVILVSSPPVYATPVPSTTPQTGTADSGQQQIVTPAATVNTTGKKPAVVCKIIDSKTVDCK